MPAPLIPRDEVIDRLREVFQRLGYDGASLAELSHGTGLGKSSLYHYFPKGKEEMALAVLRRVHAWIEENAIAPLQGQGSRKERLERMLRALDSLYAGGKNPCLLGNLVVGEARHLYQRQLRSTFSAWVEGLEQLGLEAGLSRRTARERAEDVVLQIQGALVLSGGLDDPTPFRRVLRKISKEFLAPE
jgi:TetR/AcrR family transcriptional regulator, lmrAB and yxaGH operons repressor